MVLTALPSSNSTGSRGILGCTSCLVEGLPKAQLGQIGYVLAVKPAYRKVALCCPPVPFWEVATKRGFEAGGIQPGTCCGWRFPFCWGDRPGGLSHLEGEDFLAEGVEVEAALLDVGDVAQVGGHGGAVADVDVAVGEFAGADALEEVLDVIDGLLVGG